MKCNKILKINSDASKSLRDNKIIKKIQKTNTHIIKHMLNHGNPNRVCEIVEKNKPNVMKSLGSYRIVLFFKIILDNMKS